MIVYLFIVKQFENSGVQLNPKSTIFDYSGLDQQVLLLGRVNLTSMTLNTDCLSWKRWPKQWESSKCKQKVPLIISLI